jgi:hypothetical protein
MNLEVWLDISTLWMWSFRGASFPGCWFALLDGNVAMCRSIVIVRERMMISLETVLYCSVRRNSGFFRDSTT